MSMKILVIDGQGGRLGRKLLESIRKACGESRFRKKGIVRDRFPGRT